MTALIRFITGEVDEHSHVHRGLFQAAYALERSGEMEEHERIWFDDVVGWLEVNLKVPKRHEYSLPWHSSEHDTVIFWMRESATEHVQKMRQVVAMLAHHGIEARTLRTSRPGRVVYEDGTQIGAIPYRDGVK